MHDLSSPFSSLLIMFTKQITYNSLSILVLCLIGKGSSEEKNPRVDMSPTFQGGKFALHKKFVDPVPLAPTTYFFSHQQNFKHHI